MTALTLRGLAARKLRTALTAIAVVLGVGLISGTYILTDTINRSFDDDLRRREQEHRRRDHPARGRRRRGQRLDTGLPGGRARPGASRRPGVAEAAGDVFDAANIYAKDGKQAGRARGAELRHLRAAAHASARSRTSRGAPPRAATRGRARPQRGGQGRLQARRPGRGGRPAGQAALHARRRRQVRRARTSIAGASDRDHDPARGPAGARRGRPLRRDRRPRRARRLARGAGRDACAQALPAERDRAHRRRPGALDVQGRQGRLLVRDHRAARVRGASCCSSARS